MSNFKAKMHEIRFGRCPKPCSPDPLAGFKGSTSKGTEGQEGREETNEEGEGKGEILYSSNNSSE